MLGDAGSNGHYWASVESSSDDAYILYFPVGGSLGVGGGYDKRGGHSVRCVRQ
ncbi:MAG: hypothetical protein K2N21_02580 [Rikenellaceae bacterium]|nr:hypothetical protein [Rikenellaceae bacterium]